MTQKELLSLEHLKIAEIKEGYYLHVHTEDGYYLTTWEDGSDIKEYAGTECIYAPIREEYEDYRVIDKETHSELEKIRESEVRENEME